jgi:hypothetical protein
MSSRTAFPPVYEKETFCSSNKFPDIFNLNPWRQEY